MPRRPSRRVARYGFVNNKQMAFLKNIVSQQLFFLFSKHLDTMLNVTDCGTGRTDLWQIFLIPGHLMSSKKSDELAQHCLVTYKYNNNF